ncbi:MAG TPA: presenilin family intramembrane aspartyl protease PSH [Candidatus Thalassarchaeaceae archaeon]|jgi:presenilin-like A22 family membrane protease|nr:presenilin family intramembrane aspartyl protease PSH [Candidatus Thalassarchaeaceae archaeon]
MSGEGFAAKRRSEKSADVPVKQKQRSLMEELKGQAGSMVGMAGMFVVTIWLAMEIQPFYDRDELRAFGAEGATKAGFVLLELVFIFIFTALIIYLARKNLQQFIRWGVLGVLWIAMMYTLFPLVAMVLVPDAPPFTEDVLDTSEAYIISVEEGGSSFFYMDDPLSDNGTLRYGANSGEIEYWSHVVEPEFEGNPQKTVQLTQTAGGVIICEGTQWILLDAEDGSVLDDHGINCDLGLRYEYTDSMDETCDGVDDEPQDWRIYGDKLEPIGYYNDHDGDPTECADWIRNFPEPFDGTKILFVKEIGTEHFLIVSEQWAGMVEYPTEFTGQALHQADVITTWNLSLSGGEKFTGATFGAAPGLNITGQDSLILGTSAGHITGWEISDDGTVQEGISMDLAESVRGLLLADCCSGGSNDLWVIEGDNLRVFMGGSLVEMPRSLEIGGTDSQIPMTLHNVENNETVLDDGILMMEQDGSWSSMRYTVYQADYSLTTVIALVLSIALLILLIVQPEWYVINTVGILVGAGTITMLGVSFVPWIIILFMVLAAAYDAWAVYKSKHMLELADTMVNLELPVMLVAPQRPTRGRVKIERSDESHGLERASPPKRNFDETMLMGLGDVIFPGLLCISAMSWLPDVEGPMGWSAPVLVAIGTMIGSLVGYCVLMTYVARGKPQAGLPLLNGGAILGYFISAAIFIGSSAFVFDVSLF